MFRYLSTIAFFLLVFAGCIPMARSSEKTETNMIQSTPLAMVNVENATATASPEFMTDSSNSAVLLCSIEPKSYFDIHESFGMTLLSSIQFVDEQKVELSGWIEKSPSSLEGEEETKTVIGFNQTLRRAELDLETSEAQPMTTPAFVALRRPCDGKCTLEILSQSPDGKWQLAKTEEGLWLLSQTHQIQLADFVPYSSRWQWSLDSSLLWVVRDEKEYGYQGTLVHLKESPIVQITDSTSFLDPTYNQVAFSPKDNTAISIQDNTVELDPPHETLRYLDLTQSISTTLATEDVSGLQKVVWNDATQDYFLVVATAEGLELRSHQKTFTVKLSLDAFQNVFPLVPQDKLQNYFWYVTYALSPTAQKIAIANRSGDVYIFHCEQQNQ